MNNRTLGAGDTDQLNDRAVFSSLSTTRHNCVREAYARFRTELGRFACRNYGLHDEEAEDLVHSAFEKFASLKEPAAVENPRAFLYRLVNNLALNNFRHRKVEKKYAESFVVPEDEEPSLCSPGPETITQQQQDLDGIAEKILKMPLRRRQIVIMSRFDHLSYAQIGRKLNISEAAVRKHIKRALEEIQTSPLQVRKHETKSV